jgi:DNA-binding CsgD family transcriptional regulator
MRAIVGARTRFHTSHFQEFSHPERLVSAHPRSTVLSASAKIGGGVMSVSGDLYFHQQLQRQTDVASAALMLAQCADALGWNLAAFHTDIHQATLPRAGDGEFIGTAMGWQAKTVNEWVKLGLARACPIGLHCAAAVEPFLWDCELDGAAWQGRPLQAEQRAVLNLYNNEVCGGVTVPVRRAGKTGYVSWCTRERGRLRSRYQTTLSSVHLISHTFMRQIDCLIDASEQRGDTKGLLTRREIECLTWAAHGKTTTEIADLLHRSAETVEFHLSNAMAKLDARNRAHAVAIACLRGMIREL